MKTITIGSVAFPLEDYAITGNALLGIRGAGKTYTAKGIAEQLLDFGIPIVVFDPIGQWQYLRRPRAGRGGKGFKIVVAGGADPDLPLTPESAPQIVRAAIKEGIPLVVDLYDRKLSKAEWRKIVQNCFRTLLYENEGVRHIFLEETAEFAPQKIQDGETYAEVEKLVRMGGNASLGITLINQRAQEVNKAVLDLCENLVLMRQRGSHAIDALTKWLDKLSPDFAKEISTGMPTMGQGDAWVFAGEAEHPVRTRSARIHSFHPDRRKPELLKTAGASVSTRDFVSRLSGDLNELIEKAKSDDPKALKRRIRELERTLAKRLSEGNGTVAADQREAIERPLRHAIEERDDRIADQGRVITQLREEFRDIGERCRSLAVPVKRSAIPPPPKPAAKVTAKKTNGAPQTATEYDGEPIPAGPRRTLIAIAQSTDEVTTNYLAAMTGYSTRSVTNNMGWLRTRGLVLEGWPTKITDDGMAALGNDYEPLPTGDDLREYWLRRLPEGPRRTLQALADAHPEGLSNQELAARTDYSTRSITNNTGALKTRKLILKHGNRFVARDELFG